MEQKLFHVYFEKDKSSVYGNIWIKLNFYPSSKIGSRKLKLNFSLALLKSVGKIKIAYGLLLVIKLIQNIATQNTNNHKK